MTPYQRYGGGGWNTFENPLSPELQEFSRLCGESAASLTPERASTELVAAFRQAGEALGRIAIGGNIHCNLIGIGISLNELRKIERIEFIAPGTVETAAKTFCAQRRYLLVLIADSIMSYGGEVVLL